MTGRYQQLYADNFGNMPPTVREMAKGLDQIEERMERIRIRCGFTDEWSPAYERRQRSGVNAPVKWADKAAAMNGVGDMQRLIGEMAAGLDAVGERLAEVER